jgi:hypothetical protein
MTRDICKFLSGSFAGLAYAHAAYAVATHRGIIEKPVFLGRQWGVATMWSEAAVYSAISAARAYRGWAGRSEPPVPQPARAQSDGRGAYSTAASDTSPSMTH